MGLSAQRAMSEWPDRRGQRAKRARLELRAKRDRWDPKARRDLRGRRGRRVMRARSEQPGRPGQRVSRALLDQRDPKAIPEQLASRVQRDRADKDLRLQVTTESVEELTNPTDTSPRPFEFP